LPVFKRAGRNRWPPGNAKVLQCESSESESQAQKCPLSLTKKATESNSQHARDGFLLLSQVGRFTRTLENGGLAFARCLATRLTWLVTHFVTYAA